MVWQNESITERFRRRDHYGNNHRPSSPPNPLPKKVYRSVKQTADILGEARDTDVMIVNLQARLRKMSVLFNINVNVLTNFHKKAMLSMLVFLFKRINGGALMARLIIKEIAKKQGLNQSRLQIKAGVTAQLLNRYWNNNTESVALKQLDMIAKALGVKPGDLIVSDEESARYEKEVSIPEAA